MSQSPPPINSDNPDAQYRQLKRILHAQILAGEYKHQDQLPSENQLTQDFKVSRYVVRQALQALVTEGHIVAYQGSGYFVNKKRIRKNMSRLVSHITSMHNLGCETNTLVSRQEIMIPNSVTQRMLRTGQTKMIFIERVSSIDNEPVCAIESYFPLEYRDALLGRNLDNKSIFKILEQCFELKPDRSKITISVVFADEHISSLVQIREGSPLLHVRSYIWSTDGDIFTYSSEYYRSDRLELELLQL